MTRLRGTRCIGPAHKYRRVQEARPWGLKTPRWSAERRARLARAKAQDARHASQAWLVAPRKRDICAFSALRSPLGRRKKERRGARARRSAGKAERWLGLFDIVRWKCGSPRRSRAPAGAAGIGGAEFALPLCGPPRNPGLPGFRIILRKSGRPDLRREARADSSRCDRSAPYYARASTLTSVRTSPNGRATTGHAELTGGNDAGSRKRTKRGEDVLGLQESVRLPRVRSRHGAAAAFQRSRALDSVPAAAQGQGRAQRLFRIQGQVLLYGCAPCGEGARPLDPRSAENLRHDSGGDRRAVCGKARPLARLWPCRVQAVLPSRIRSRSARSGRAAHRRPRPVRPGLSRIPVRRRPRGLRALPGGSGRGSRVRRAVLYFPRRAVLGARSDAAARAVSRRSGSRIGPGEAGGVTGGRKDAGGRWGTRQISAAEKR